MEGGVRASAAHEVTLEETLLTEKIDIGRNYGVR
jgi:hypothetical protein